MIGTVVDEEAPANSFAELKLLKERCELRFGVRPGGKASREVLRLLDPQLMIHPFCLELLR